MNCEPLEARLLLTSGPMVYTSYDSPTKKVTITTAALGISNDVIVLSVSAGNTFSVSVGGVNDFNTAFANVLSISVDGGSGNDRINLGATTKPINVPTTLNGGNGADTITGGAANDQIFGGSGNDSIDGGLGADSISGGADNDTISYATRAAAVNVNINDLLANDGAAGEGDWAGFGTGDIESIMGGSGNDTLTGGGGANYISGGAGADLIHGNSGSDTIVGGAGGDSLYGDNDADFIFAKDGEFDLIDGGPGIDAADVDTNPVEAPLPDAPLAAPATVASPEAAASVAKSPVLKGVPLPAKVFSIRRVKPGKPTRASLATLSPGAQPAPLPAPPPDDNVEGPIDPAILPSLIQSLDPYCAGQVLTMRDSQGTVNSSGTGGDDVFLVATTPGTAGVDVTNNEGLTQWPLPSSTILINGQGGSDQLIITGGIVTYTPGNTPGSGVIVSDGHTIVYSNLGQSAPAFSNVNSLTIVMPNQGNTLHLGSQPGIGPELDGGSGALSIGTIGLDQVQLLTLDLAKNNSGAGSDILAVTDMGPTPPSVALLTGGAQTGGTTVLVNTGLFILANNPVSNPNINFKMNVIDGAAVRFDAPITNVGKFILAGHAQISPGGGKVLIASELDLGPDGTLDLADNSFILAPPAGTPPDTQIASALQTSHQNGWTGGGIVSSVAAANSNKAIGYANAGALFGPNGGAFKGVGVNASATLVSVTINGDFNLDGGVGFADLVKVAQHFGQQGGASWLGGDANYDGQVSFADLVAVAQHYGNIS